jgi:hypothetical protein
VGDSQRAFSSPPVFGSAGFFIWVAMESNFNKVVCDAIKVGAANITAAISAVIATLFSAFGTVAFDRGVKIAKVALAAVDTGGGLFAWANPEAGAIIVQRVTLDVTTNTSGACTANIGTTATSATTSSDNLIDGVSLATAAKVVDNLGDAGTNGKTRQKLAAGKWVTGSVDSGASAGLVGFAYIEYYNA